MFIGPILEAFEEHLSSYFALDKVPVQLMPDDRPRPFSGQQVITVYGNQFSRVDPTKDARIFRPVTNICVTQRTPQAPDNNIFKLLYTTGSKVNKYSLSTLVGIIINIIDTNNNLINIINNKYSSIVDDIVERYESTSRGVGFPTATESQFLQNLQNSQVITPIRVTQATAEPIVRTAEYFTAYDTKIDLTYQSGNDRIVAAGYSVVLTVTGPIITLPFRC